MMKNHNEANNNLKAEEIHPFEYNLKLIPFGEFWEKRRIDHDKFKSLRYHINGKNNQKSIIVFGCSFAEGAFLEDNETFEYQLAKATGRTVYNRGISGFGLAQMLWQTKSELFYEDIDEEPEYVIYIYISDHLRRIYEHKYGHINVFLGYKKQNDQMVEDIPLTLQLNRFHIVKNFMKNKVFPQYLSFENSDENFDLIKNHFIESKKELQKRYPNIKFIIIKHPFGTKGICPQDEYELWSTYSTNRWKELEDEGFIIHDLGKFYDIDFESDEYTVPDGHPNAKAWNVVVKKLVKDLNL